MISIIKILIVLYISTNLSISKTIETNNFISIKYLDISGFPELYILAPNENDNVYYNTFGWLIPHEIILDTNDLVKIEEFILDYEFEDNYYIFGGASNSSRIFINLYYNGEIKKSSTISSKFRINCFFIQFKSMLVESKTRNEDLISMIDKYINT